MYDSSVVRNVFGRGPAWLLVVGCACMTVSSGAVATELQQGLVAYWPLDDGTGEVIADAYGMVADIGQLRNSPDWLSPANSKLGASALGFDGVEQDVLLPISDDLDIGTNAVSLSAWVNLDLFPSEMGDRFGGILDSASDSYVLYLDRANQELRFKVTDSDGTAERPGIAESMLSTESWNHVMGVYDGAEGVAKIFWNGALVDKHANPGLIDLVAPGQLGGIGANPTLDPDNPSVYFLAGAIDDVAVWNRSLGRAEASYLYNNGLGNAVGAANPNLLAIPDEPVVPVMPTATPVVDYGFDGNLRNAGSGGSVLDATLLDTSGVNDALYTVSRNGAALDLRDNPVSQAVDGDAVSVDYTLTDTGTIVFDYSVDEFFNFQSLWTNSVNQDDWEMWIYDDGRVRGRVEGDAFVTFDLDNLGGEGTYQIAFTWERDDANVELKLYVDGELRDQDLVGSWVAPGETFYIGSGDGANHYGTGIWDEFRIYDIALTDGELLYLFQNALLPGDYDGSGVLDAADLDLMAAAIQSGDVSFDLDADGDIDFDDRSKWVVELSKTWFGDSNLDGEFNSGDFVAAFTNGKYETGEAALWSDGDWTGDGVFNSSDFVAAFMDGGYEIGPRVAVAAVPEPSAPLMLLGCFFAWHCRRYSNRFSFELAV